MRRALVLALAFAAASACGSSAPKPAPAAPSAGAARRVGTAGADLLAVLPAGASLVAELDLARLRQNDVVGAVLKGLAPHVGEEAVGLGVDPLRALDLVVLAVYDLGTPAAATVILARGATLDPARVASASPEAVPYDETTVLFAPDAFRGAVGPALEAATPARLAADAELLALRDEAMPVLAPGASLRVTARLSAEARAEVTREVGMTEVPATVSLWMDVADDLALVALLGGDDASGAERLSQALLTARDLWAAALPARWGLSVPLAEARVEPVGAVARVAWVVPPRMLRAWAARVLRASRSPG